jgi:hypothetical protein
MVQGLIGEKVVPQVVDDVIVTLLGDHSELYAFEVSHVQGLCVLLMHKTQRGEFRLLS